MQELLDFASHIAREAGRLTLKYFGKRIDVEDKADLSPVTIADREAERYLRAEIEKRFPEDGLLGEEYGEKKGSSGRRWILDPIDGTKSFIRGIPMYGTLVAVEVNGEVPVGAVYFPPSDELLAARTGGGCRLNGEPCRVSGQTDLSKAMVVVTAFNDVLKHQGEAALNAILRKTGIQRTWGDCYGYLLVATGRADIAFDPVMNPWDIAPMLPIIREAGGAVTSIRGEKSLAAMTATVASNGVLHEAALALFKK